MTPDVDDDEDDETADEDFLLVSLLSVIASSPGDVTVDVFSGATMTMGVFMEKSSLDSVLVLDFSCACFMDKIRNISSHQKFIYICIRYETEVFVIKLCIE